VDEVTHPCESGWLSTIAAIAMIQSGDYGTAPYPLTQAILDAWPEDLLQ